MRRAGVLWQASLSTLTLVGWAAAGRMAAPPVDLRPVVIAAIRHHPRSDEPGATTASRRRDAGGIAAGSDSADFRAAIDRDRMSCGPSPSRVSLFMSFPTVRRRSPVSSLTLWAWLVLTAAPSPQPFSVSGTVVDPEGKPVKGATVWLTAFVRFDADVEELAQVETDAEGRFTIDAPVGGGDRPRSLTLWAHSPGTRVAIASPSNRPKDDRGPIRLALGPPARTPVRVLGVDGKPVAGATVRLSPLDWPAGLRARLEATTDARGRAAIEGVDPGQIYRVDVTADGLGTQGHNVPHGRGGEDRAAPAGRPGRGADRVGRPEGPGRLDGRRLVPSRRGEPFRLMRRTRRAAGATKPAGSRSGPSRRGESPSASSRPRARRSSPCPPRRRRWRSAAARASRSRSRSGRGSRSRDRCGSTAARKPAAGVKVNLIVLSPYRRNEDVVTDAEGRFSRYFLPCKLRVSLTWFDLPDRYFHAPDAHWADYDLAAGEESANARPAGGLAGGRDQGDGGRRGGQARRGGPGERLVHRPGVRRPVDPGQHPDGRARGLRARPDGARLDRGGPGVHRGPRRRRSR